MDVQGATPRNLDKRNQVWLCLRVITIAEIKHELGGGVYPGPRTHRRVAIQIGFRMAMSALPSKGLLGNVLTFLRLTVCCFTETSQSAHFSMTLYNPLGAWHHLQHHAWFTCYQTESVICHQDKDQGILRVFHKKGTFFYHYVDTVLDLPIQIHLITCQTVGQSY